MDDEQPGVPERLSSLEERVTALERAADAPPEALDGRGRPEAGGATRFWVLEGLAAEAAATPGGAVVYAGHVTLPTGEEFAWQRTHAAEQVRGDDDVDGAVAPALAALAHPVRLRLLREVLSGSGSTAALAALPGLGTSGRLHHHLRQLTAAGWLRTTARGAYTVPADKVVPLHVVLAAVSG